jgi:hypothetical protein
MLTPTQAKKCKHVRRLKKRLLDKGLSVKELGAQIGHSRSVTSRAINQQCFPRVLAKIEEVLEV